MLPQWAYSKRMRWSDFFADLESQLQFEQWHAVEQEAAELTRGMWADITLMDRLRPALGQSIRLILQDGRMHQVTLQAVGPTWVGGLDEAGAVMIPGEAILAVDADLRRAHIPIKPLRAGPTISAVYRGLARRREALQVVSRDGTVLAEGTIDRVGKDHIDVALHARDEFRRAAAVRGRRVIAFETILLVRASRMGLSGF